MVFHVAGGQGGRSDGTVYSRCAVYRELGAGVPRCVPGPALVPGVEHPRAVLVWELRSILHDGDRSVAEWYFKNTVDGRMEEFDGLSLIHWSGDGRIRRLQEFGCQRDRYDPYADGPDPKFQERPSLWF